LFGSAAVRRWISRALGTARLGGVATPAPAMRARRGWWAASAVLLLALVAGSVALAESLQSGEIGPALGITANGRALHPVGRLTTVGNFPTEAH